MENAFRAPRRICFVREEEGGEALRVSFPREGPRGRKGVAA